ncbi:hypothetical protein ACLOJK_013249 [Asimina triloba]
MDWLWLPARVERVDAIAWTRHRRLVSAVSAVPLVCLVAARRHGRNRTSLDHGWVGQICCCPSVGVVVVIGRSCLTPPAGSSSSSSHPDGFVLAVADTVSPRATCCRGHPIHPTRLLHATALYVRRHRRGRWVFQI